jgi:hypothetical protein
MAELTLESLAARIAELERKQAAQLAGIIPLSRDWRCVVGISEDNEFTRDMLAEIEANSGAEQRAAQEDSR